jgi:uncharacterized protein HemX
MTTTRVIVLALLALVVAAGVAIGGWQLHWWVAQSAQGHQNHIQRYTYGFQTAQLQDAEAVYTQIAALDSQIQQQPSNAAPLDAQKSALDTQFCGDMSTLVTLTPPADLTTFAHAACDQTVNP